MKKTYITTVPDHIGAFLRASRCFSALGINITRASYNKAVDSNLLFLDVEGTAEQLAKADEELKKIGYLKSTQDDTSVILLEFRLRDIPGSVTKILELIDRFHFNISYISSQENGSEYQLFKMGLFVDDPERVKKFLQEAEQFCSVRPLDYNHAERVYDNSIFYHSFVTALSRQMNLSEPMKQELMVNSNLAMQTLDEKGLSPYRTFDSISKFAELLAACRGDKFAPRISRHTLSEKTELTLIEPPCGSNTAILQNGDQALFIDTGYACYREEMETLFRRILPDYDGMEKTVLISHADLDHCGLLPGFDHILASAKSAACLRLEYEGKDGFREQNALHRPYIRICKILTGYLPPDPAKVEIRWGDESSRTEPLWQVGFFDFGDLHFEVYEGKGGHLPGEIILIDYEHHIAFTGDVYINIHGMTPEQARYNRYAPILMTSVDTDPALCAAERTAVLQRLGAGDWKIFGAHGAMKEYGVNVAK